MVDDLFPLEIPRGLNSNLVDLNRTHSEKEITPFLLHILKNVIIQLYFPWSDSTRYRTNTMLRQIHESYLMVIKLANRKRVSTKFTWQFKIIYNNNKQHANGSKLYSPFFTFISNILTASLLWTNFQLKYVKPTYH